MVRRIRNRSLETRTARLALKPAKKPVFVSLGRGLSLGYRRNKNGAGTWVFRKSNGKGGMETAAIGFADDFAEADGNEALDYVQAQAVVIAKAKPGFVHHRGNITVPQAFEGYLPALAARNQRGANLTAGRVRKHILPTLGHRKVVELSTTELEKWQASMVKKSDDKEVIRRSKDSANRVLTMLKAILNHAWNDKNNAIPSDDAWRKVKPYRNVAKPREVRFSPEQAKTLIDNAETPEFEDLVTGGYLTGARYEELADARVKDFDRRAKQLYVFGKTDGRNVLLQPDAQSLLKRLTDGRQPEDFIFRREDGGKWSPSDQVRRMKAAIELAGLDPRGTFYALRHSYISEAIENNIPLTVIAENCGTSVRMIEVTYAKVLAQKKRQFIEQGAPRLHGSMS